MFVVFGESDVIFCLMDVNVIDSVIVGIGMVYGYLLFYKVVVSGCYYVMNGFVVFVVVDVLVFDFVIVIIDFGCWESGVGCGLCDIIQVDLVDNCCMIELIDDVYNVNLVFVCVLFEVLFVVELLGEMVG